MIGTCKIVTVMIVVFVGGGGGVVVVVAVVVTICPHHITTVVNNTGINSQHPASSAKVPVLQEEITLRRVNASLKSTIIG